MRATRVERVAADEVRRTAHGLALPLVLVAPVRLALWIARKVEVEVRRSSRRARGPREHDAEHVSMLVVADDRPKGEQLREARGAYQRRRYGLAPATRPVELVEPGGRLADVALERARLYRVVLTRIRSALNAAMSTPVASRSLSSACTSVVPEPANGSSTRPPGRT